MTQVLIDLRKPVETGELPANVRMSFTPTKRRVVEDHVVLPNSFSLVVTDPVTVILAPTTPDWCWRIDEGLVVRHVSVPDTAVVVPYVDLIEVDPATLTPVETAVPLWDAAILEAEALLAATIAARNEALGSAIDAIVAEEAAEASKVAAAASQVSAAGSASSATTSATTATTKATEAAASAATATSKAAAATSSASNALVYSNGAMSSATIATNKANSASTSATNAATSASAAATSASTAGNRANDATAAAALAIEARIAAEAARDQLLALLATS